MTTYRAVLKPDPVRADHTIEPMQTFHPNVASAVEWAKGDGKDRRGVLATAKEGSRVEIFVTEERLVETVIKS